MKCKITIIIISGRYLFTLQLKVVVKCVVLVLVVLGYAQIGLL